MWRAAAPSEESYQAGWPCAVHSRPFSSLPACCWSSWPGPGRVDPTHPWWTRRGRSSWRRSRQGSSARWEWSRSPVQLRRPQRQSSGACTSPLGTRSEGWEATPVSRWQRQSNASVFIQVQAGAALKIWVGAGRSVSSQTPNRPFTSAAQTTAFDVGLPGIASVSPAHRPRGGTLSAQTLNMPASLKTKSVAFKVCKSKGLASCF